MPPAAPMNSDRARTRPPRTWAVTVGDGVEPKTDCVAITHFPRVNLAVLTFDGKGNYFSRFVTNDNGAITRGTLLGLGYRVNADCTGVTLGDQGVETGVIIVLQGGDEFSFVRTNPSSLVILGAGKRIRGSD